MGNGTWTGDGVTIESKECVVGSPGDQGQTPDLRSSHFWWGETRPERTGGRPLSNFRRLPNHLWWGQVPDRPMGAPVDGSVVVIRQQETRKHCEQLV